MVSPGRGACLGAEVNSPWRPLFWGYCLGNQELWVGLDLISCIAVGGGLGASGCWRWVWSGGARGETRGESPGWGRCCHILDKAGQGSDLSSWEWRKEADSGSSSEGETTHWARERRRGQGDSRGQVGGRQPLTCAGKLWRAGEFFKEVSWEECEFELSCAEFECWKFSELVGTREMFTMNEKVKKIFF